MLRLSWLLVPALLLWVASSSTGATQKAAPTKPKSSTKSNTKSKSKSTAKAASKKSATRTTSSRRRKASFRSGQQKPTPERYTEIQSALARKGYLAGEPGGTWNEQSTEALRRFQQDQNLKPDGKITSHSLIALGLGPKRGTPPPAPSAPVPPQ